MNLETNKTNKQKRISKNLHMKKNGREENVSSCE